MPTDAKHATGGDRLHIDRFGLSIGPVSVGLPRACTADDVYQRYLDLLGIIRRDPDELIEAPPGDLDALSAATSADRDYVARRLVALQVRGAG